MSANNDNLWTRLTRVVSDFFVEPGSDWMQICVDLRTGQGCGKENDYRDEFCWSCGRMLRHSLKVLKQDVQVGAYRIGRLIGYGSFGAVYEAQDVRRVRRVALKETFDANHIKSYGYEFAVLRQLAHPNLPRYEEVFQERNHGYLVMEFVRGQSLQDILDRQNGPLLESQVMGIALQLCDVLSYLHNQRLPILHRDIKPDNIRLTPEGLIKLVDFGLLKQGIGKTGTLRRGWTEGYAPLEQYPNSTLGTTPQSDIYSLGATLYHLLTGEAPVSAQNRLIASNNPQQDDPLRPPQAHNPQLSAHVANAIMHAMQLHPSKRYPNADAFKGALTSPHAAAQPSAVAQSAPPRVTPPPTPAPAAPTRRKSPPVPKPEPKVIIPERQIHVPKIKVLRAGDRMTSPKDGMIMVYVPAGEFLMGSQNDDPAAYDDEKPQRQVYLDAFWMDLHPVTNAQFARFAQETGYQTEAEKYGWSYLYYGSGKTQGANWRHPRGPKSDLSGKENHPVVHVTWNDAFAYSQWAGRRLPTEAEWEKAARGTDGRIYPWGNAEPNDKLLNFKMNVKDTTPVGNYPAGASPYGALDMAGNVWEWTNDWYDADYYKDAPLRNPQGPDTRGSRVLRGASWNNVARRVRAGNRGRNAPAGRDDDNGARCAASP